jgi:hypothetical protein
MIPMRIGTDAKVHEVLQSKLRSLEIGARIRTVPSPSSGILSLFASNS